MGTSASSNGPGEGVPFDPPWLDDIAPQQPVDDMQPDDQGDDGPDDVDQNDGSPEQPSHSPLDPAEIAPTKRFHAARRAIGSFVRTGKQESLEKAFGHYSKTGMGGARNAANRMRLSTKSAANLFGILQSAREGSDPGINMWVSSLTGRHASAQDIVDEIIRRIAPSGGSLDETSCRESMAQAMELLLEEKPTVNLLHLDDDDIWALAESFLGYEAFIRLCLDIGQVFENSSLSPREVVIRMNEMQDYLKAELGAQIQELRQNTPHARSNQLQAILQKALQNTFLVYEGSL